MSIDLRAAGLETPIKLEVQTGALVAAVSPVFSLEEVEGGVQITVSDIDGTKSALIPSGPQGETGPQGIQGETGPQGPKGETGTKGDKGDTGPQGAQGEQGPEGVGIASIVFNSDYTLTITLANGRSYTTESIRGPKGEQGEQGIQGIQGIQGETGAKGETGATGAAGKDGAPGKDGADGQDGTDGVSPTIGTSEIIGGHRLTITDANGTRTVDVMDGVDGQDGSPGSDGSPGADGYSPTASVTKSGNVVTITITDKTGTTTESVTDVTVDSTLSDNSINPVQNKTIKSALDGKQGALTFDSAPTEGSNNPVTSGGIKSAIDTVANAVPTKVSDLYDDSGHYTKPSGGIPASDLASGVIPDISGKQDALTFDTAPTANSTNPVTSGGVKTAIDAVAGAIPTKVSDLNDDSGHYTKPANGIPASDIASGVIPDISGKQDALTFDSVPTASSTNPVTSDGVYTALQAKADPVTVDTVSGTTPAITGVANHRYMCGECSTLSITVPASGIIDVVFESGSTPTVLTVTPPSGKIMKWPGWFDPTSLEANATYEINIMDGNLGTVMAWT